MNKVKLSLFVAACLLAVGFNQPVFAHVIDFSDVQGARCSPALPVLQSGGFTFRPAGINVLYACGPLELAQNRTRAIASVWGGPGTITFEPSNGGVFSLGGFGAGSVTTRNHTSTESGLTATGLLVEGLSGSNVVASSQVTLNGLKFSTFAFDSSFSNLTSVKITPTGKSNIAIFALDNVYINEPVGAVPEPTTWAMMILGFGMIGFAMRRQSSKAGIRFGYRV